MGRLLFKEVAGSNPFQFFTLVCAVREAIPARMVSRSGGRKPSNGARARPDARDLEGHGGAARRRTREADWRFELQLPIGEGPAQLCADQTGCVAGNTLFKNWPIPASFCLFSSFPYHTI